MSSVNKIVLIGRVGKDPEIRSMPGGSRVANFTLATSESWKDKGSGERKEKVEWHRISIFNDKIISVVEKYIKKGTHLYIDGSLETRKWVDAQGKDNFSTEIVLRPYRGEIVILSEKNKDQSNEAASLDDSIPW